MGATEVWHRFNHYDWRLGVAAIKKATLDEYGHQQGFSGQLHDVTHIGLHRPTVTFKNDKQLYDYIQKRFERIEKRDGEVIDLGISGYSIAKPVIQDYRGPQMWDSTVFKGVQAPAILLRANYDFYRASPVSKGTVAELKEQARKLAMKEKFEHDYIILGKNIANPLVVTGEGKMVKSTTMTSDANKLVLPYHNWIVYGIAPE